VNFPWKNQLRLWKKPTQELRLQCNAIINPLESGQEKFQNGVDHHRIGRSSCAKVCKKKASSQLTWNGLFLLLLGAVTAVTVWENYGVLSLYLHYLGNVGPVGD
jgi:hypothetical protein